MTFVNEEKKQKEKKKKPKQVGEGKKCGKFLFVEFVVYWVYCWEGL